MTTLLANCRTLYQQNSGIPPVLFLQDKHLGKVYGTPRATVPQVPMCTLCSCTRGGIGRVAALHLLGMCTIEFNKTDNHRGDLKKSGGKSAGKQGGHGKQRGPGFVFGSDKRAALKSIQKTPLLPIGSLCTLNHNTEILVIENSGEGKGRQATGANFIPMYSISSRSAKFSLMP